MSRQNIDFEQGSTLTGDSGERGDAALIGVKAIKPYADGEPATSSVLDRSPENLRKRTEVLRTQGEGQKYLADSDMRWIITCGHADGSGDGGVPTITAWSPTSGTFTLSDAIVVQPLNTPNTDKKETVTYSFPTAAPTEFLYISSLLFDFDLANTLRIVWEAVDPALIGGTVPGRCDYALSGEGNHILTISYADDGACEMVDLDTLLTSAPALVVLNAAGFDCATSMTTPTTPILIADFTPIGSNPADYTMSGTFDRELHYIPPASFSDFFAVPNSLTDGDTLAIMFSDLHVASAYTGRRDRVPGKANTLVDHVDLFITSDNPENIPGCIPLCKRIEDDLLWLDGTFCYTTVSPISPYPLRFGEHGYTVNRIANVGSLSLVNIVTLWKNAVLPTGATSTLNAALNGIVADLASITTGGGFCLGTPAIPAAAPDSLATTSVSGQLGELLTLANARIRTYAPAALSANWVLLWRSDNVVLDAAVTKQTTSLYWRNTGEFSIVVGAYWNAATPAQIVPGTGVGTVTMSLWSTVTSQFIMATKTLAAAGVGFTAATAANWTTFESTGATAPTNMTYGVQKTFDNNIKYGVDRVVLREAFSSTDWTLVYRNNGKTTVYNDADDHTLSVYERVTADGVERLEIYGGYLDGSNYVVAAGTALANVNVSFVFHGNGDGEYARLSGTRVNVLVGTTMSITVPTDWNRLEKQEIGSSAAWETYYGLTVSDMQIWDIVTSFKQPATFENEMILHDGVGFLRGSSPGATSLYPLFISDSGASESVSIWYNDNVIYHVTNAVYDNGTHTWSLVDHHLNASATRIGLAGYIYQYIKRNTGVPLTWSMSDWDAKTQFDHFGTRGSTDYRGMLFPGTDWTTNITDGYHGLLVVNADFAGGPGNRTAILRMEGSEVAIVSAAVTIWGIGGAGTFCSFDITAGYLTVSNTNIAASLNEITIATYGTI